MNSIMDVVLLQKNHKQDSLAPSASGKKLYAQYHDGFSLIADEEHTEDLHMTITASITVNKPRPIYHLRNKGHDEGGFIVVVVTGSISNMNVGHQGQVATDYCINLKLASYHTWYWNKSLRDLLEPTQIAKIEQTLYETFQPIVVDVSECIKANTEFNSKSERLVNRTFSFGYSFNENQIQSNG